MVTATSVITASCWTSGFSFPDARGYDCEDRRNQKRQTDYGEEKIFRVFGKVTDVKTNKPLTATSHSTPIRFIAPPPTREENIFKIPSVNEYTIRVEASGYVGNFEKLDVRNLRNEIAGDEFQASADRNRSDNQFEERAFPAKHLQSPSGIQ